MAVMDKPHGLVNGNATHKSPPSFEHRMYSPHSIAAVVDELEGQGVDPIQVLEGTGLAAPQLSRHTTRTPGRPSVCRELPLGPCGPENGATPPPMGCTVMPC